MSITNEEAKQKVDDLLKVNGSRFNNWELEFVDSLEYMTKFSELQLEKIEELWRKHCGNPR